MPKEFKVLSVIICEDLREEARGKVSANGILDDEILVASFPAMLPKLSFRVLIETHISRPKTVHIAVLGDKGTRLVDNTGSTTRHAGSGPENPKVAIAFAVAGIVFQQEENFRVMLGYGGKDHLAGKFSVRLPRNEEERSRVA